MAANYNNAAWFYDRLSKLVYGDSLVKAQLYLLDFLLPNSNVLIVGGGTGWILEEITKRYHEGLKITYVEVSENMMALSKKRNYGSNEVIFINEAIEHISNEETHDVVLTCFLFDNFTDHTVQKVFEHIHIKLKPTGLWLNADFQLAGKWWQQPLLNSMLFFFRILCRIESKKLPDMESVFASNGYRSIAKKTFFGEFILSQVYQKM